MADKVAIIIGAGPAGLTAGFELLKKTNIKPIILESSNEIGGISKTVNYKGNRMDIGGHRFFSKSDVVMKWWLNIMPLQGSDSIDDIILKKEKPKQVRPKQLDKNGVDPETTDKVLLFRNRLSRIFFLRKLFDYPIALNLNTITNLGLIRIIKILFSYLAIRFFPRRNETSLEDFFINRFGKELYKTFFKDYTEKVWGVPCDKIAADWGAQRIKGLSISKTILHAIKSILTSEKSIEQKNTDTSLIGQFLYPKLGPGSMWETVASIIESNGGQILMNSNVIELIKEKDNIVKLQYQDDKGTFTIEGDYFFSTMPVVDLINGLKPTVPKQIKDTANGLQYRDFITVGLLLSEMKIKNTSKIVNINDLIPDNWIYIQERDVKVGRIQIFNNWSPYMVKNPNHIWLGLEYFCNIGDDLWSKTDEQFIDFAINELCSINMIDKKAVLDHTIVRMPKTYPAYFGTYNDFHQIREYTDKIDNLFLIGRNGMHKYNNADHSMLTAITAVDNIKNGIKSKENIWNINTEEDYHEEKK